MLRTAKDCLKIREEKLNIFNKTQEEIKGQMKLIESKVSLGYLNQSFQNAVREGINYGLEQGLYVL